MEQLMKQQIKEQNQTDGVYIKESMEDAAF